MGEVRESGRALRTLDDADRENARVEFSLHPGGSTRREKRGVASEKVCVPFSFICLLVTGLGKQLQ